jgi:minor extracellular serine protease Vpr
MRLRSKSLHILLTIGLTALTAAPALIPFSRPAHAQLLAGDASAAKARPAPDATDPAAAQALLNSADSVTGIFELQAEPLVPHGKGIQPIELRAERVDLASTQARAYAGSLLGEQRTFEAQAANIWPGIRVIAELRTLTNAVSIKAPGNLMAQIAALPGVRSFHLSRRYHAVLDKSVPLINAPALWAQLGGAADAGKGIKIAIVDSGIDITNPLFSDTGFTAPPGFPIGDSAFTNNKVIAAEAFLDDPASTPEDEFGHGSNVAGIAAGDLNTSTPLGPITGVAPAAFLGNYRVLDDQGSGDESLVAEGLEQAFTDGFEVGNLSLGAPAIDPPDVVYEAVENAVLGGMVVAVAAGNDGPAAGTVNSPGTAPDAITVGASSNAHSEITPAVTVNGTGKVPAHLVNMPATLGFTCALVSPPVGPLAVLDESTESQPLGCNPAKLSPNSLSGKIALIERGACSFAVKINNAAGAGATAAIIYNATLGVDPSDGGNNLVIMEVTGTTIPSVFMGRKAGVALKSWVDSNPSATVTISQVLELPEQPDVLASFSSQGPTLDGVLKPDVSAPGVNIYSAAIKMCNLNGVSDPSGFLSISGTSMATPHVAGSAALLLQLNPGWTPAQVKSALVNSSEVSVVTAAGSTTAAGVLAAGSGRIDLAQASAVAATLTPASLSFGVNKLNKTGHAASLDQTLTAIGVGTGSTEFKVTVVPLSLGTGVTVTPSTDSLMVTGGQPSSLTVTIAAKKNAQRGNQTGFIVLTPESGPTLRAPFWVEF